MRKILSILTLQLIFIANSNGQDTTNYRKFLFKANTFEEDDKYACLAKGMIYQNLEKFDSSLYFYDKAIELNEKSKIIENKTSIIFTIKADTTNSGYQDQFSTGMVYFYCGVVCHNLGKLDSAILNYNKMKIINPKFNDVYYQLALVYLDKKQYQLAIDELDKPRYSQIASGG